MQEVVRPLPDRLAESQPICNTVRFAVDITEQLAIIEPVRIAVDGSVELAIRIADVEPEHRSFGVAVGEPVDIAIRNAVCEPQ